MNGQTKDALIGSVLGGRYEVITFIEQGGMGSIYRAKDQRISSRAVAVKFLHQNLNPASVERFLREVHTTARINHPNIIQVHDTGVTTRGDHYFVMEFLRGSNLTSILKKAPNQRLPWPRLRRIALQICDALQAAHDVGVIHRDLKPANIFCLDKRNDFVKVLDFGIAKLVSETTINDLTKPQDVLGTVRYLAPESIRGENIGPAVDIYALGIVLYQALLGDYPLKASNLTDLVRIINRVPPRPLLERDPTLKISPETDQAILQALEKDPSGRYATMSEFRAALESASPNATRSRRTLQFVPDKRLASSARPPPPPPRRSSGTGPTKSVPPLPKAWRSSRGTIAKSGSLADPPNRKSRHPSFPLPTPKISSRTASRVLSGTVSERVTEAPTRQWKPEARDEELETTIRLPPSRPRNEVVQVDSVTELPTQVEDKKTIERPAKKPPNKPKPRQKNRKKTNSPWSRSSKSQTFWREVRGSFTRKNIPRGFLAASVLGSIFVSAVLTTALAVEVSAKNRHEVDDVSEPVESAREPAKTETIKKPAKPPRSLPSGFRPKKDEQSTVPNEVPPDETPPPGEQSTTPTANDNKGGKIDPRMVNCKPFCTKEGEHVEVVASTLSEAKFTSRMKKHRHSLRRKCKKHAFVGANHADVKATISGETGKPVKIETDISTHWELGNCVEEWLNKHLRFAPFMADSVTHSYRYTFPVD